MCTAREWFNDYKVLQRPGVGDGRFLKVLGHGKVRLVRDCLVIKLRDACSMKFYMFQISHVIS